MFKVADSVNAIKFKNAPSKWKVFVICSQCTLANWEEWKALTTLRVGCLWGALLCQKGKESAVPAWLSVAGDWRDKESMKQIPVNLAAFWGMKIENPSVWAFYFFSVSIIQGKIMAKPFISQGYALAIIIASVPGQHLWPKSGSLAWLQVFQNCGSMIIMLKVKTLTAQDHHWQNSRKTFHRNLIFFLWHWAQQSTDRRALILLRPI